MQDTASSENKPPKSVGFIVHNAVPNGSESEEAKPNNRPMRPVGMVMMLSVIDKVEIHISKSGVMPPRTPAAIKNVIFCRWPLVYLTSNFDSM